MGLVSKKEFREMLRKAPASVRKLVLEELDKQPKPKLKKKGPNKLEIRYANHLAMLKLAGKIKDYAAQPKPPFEIAYDCVYNCDFRVVLNDGSVEYHETKGFMRDDAWVKLKVSARQNPQYTFRLVKWIKGQWQIKEVHK